MFPGQVCGLRGQVDQAERSQAPGNETLKLRVKFLQVRPSRGQGWR